MAKAEVTCTCRFCGKQFTKAKICRNRAEADSFESWALENCDQCPDCWREGIREQEAEKAKAFNLPALEAVSEKQRAYAERKRNHYCAENGDLLDALAEALADIENGEARKRAEEAGKDYEEVLARFHKRYRVGIAVLTESNAGTLLDAMTGYRG